MLPSEDNSADRFNLSVGSDKAQDEKNAEANEALSVKNQSLERRLRDERFVWIVVATIVFDSLALRSMASWGGPIVIGILELVALVVLARILEVSDIVRLMEQILSAIKKG